MIIIEQGKQFGHREDQTPTRLNVTIPVFNEESLLSDSITRLHAFLGNRFREPWEIVVANNGSTDRTLEIATSLSKQLSGVRVCNLDQPGRGRALKQVWMESHADILSYMDADLSTDLSAFPSLVEAVVSGGYDIATGSRLLKPELITRSRKREVISRTYNALVKAMLGTHFSDAQCGFKALTRQVAQRLLPSVKDNNWFFDTELLAIGEHEGFRIFDLPVQWTENRKSSVNVLRTALEDVKGLVRLRREWPKQRHFIGQSR